MAEKTKRQSFLHGATILMAAIAIVKIIGAIFKIPLQRILGETGIAYYQTAYDIYLPIYSLAMAGLPVAVSRMVSESIALGRYRDARAFRKIAQRVFLLTGIAGTIIILLAAYPFVLITDNKNSLLPILCTAPSLLFCCMMSSYRGYYEGTRNMYPTAVSSIIEAAGKLFIGLGGAFAVIKIGMSQFEKTGKVFGKIIVGTEKITAADRAFHQTLPYAAAASIAGITLGTVFGAIYLFLRHKRGGDGMTREQLISSPAPRPTNQNLKLLIAVSVPIVIGSLAQNIAGLVDVTQVQFQLKSVYENNTAFMNTLYGGVLQTREDPTAFLYGCSKGIAHSVYNLVPTLTSIFGVSAIPALATAWTKRDPRSIRKNVETILRISALFVLPIAISISAMSGPIMTLLNPEGEGAGNLISGPVLKILGIAAVFSGLTMPLTNMLQAIGRQKIPVRNMLISVVLKIVVNFSLVRIPGVNIIGSPVGTLCCFMCLFILNFIALVKYSKVRPNFFSVLIKPLIAAGMCAATAWVTHSLLTKAIESTKIATVAAILAAGIIYVLAIILLRALSEDDIKSFPGGERLAAKLKKMHVVG